MKKFYNYTTYLVLIGAVIVLGVINLHARTSDVSKEVNTQLVSNYKNEIANLCNVEQNVLQIEYLFNHSEFQLFFEDEVGEIHTMNSMLDDSLPCLYYFFHENSCYSCVDIEMNRIIQLHESLNFPIKFIFTSENWKTGILTKRDYSNDGEFIKMTVEGEGFNEELLYTPFYFIIDNNKASYFFIPIKEDDVRTHKYFDFINEDHCSRF
ncbi:MAG: hypothetical protein JEZ03_00480 [Bacteroidales bacterium]|nr:hypothetical protein [Bacteroidales bacterium]